MEQTKQELQNKIRVLHDECGIPYSFLSRKIGVSSNMASLYLKGKAVSEFVENDLAKVVEDIIFTIKQL